MDDLKHDGNKQEPSESYIMIYDLLISRVYDKALKVGLTPIGEQIIRMSVYHELKPFIRRNSKILDCCCGTGTLTLLITKLIYKSCQVYGIDISHGQIERAKEKNSFDNLKFIQMDANSLEFKDESFDIVIISAALHEMDKNLRLNVLTEIYRVLKNGGIFLVFEHHEPKNTIKRILFNFYLGFWENLLSNSLKLQRSLLFELKKVGYNVKFQKPIHKFFDFFQIILCEK
jgi:ubiquinone/menaquinone biosynthesis C-methylase UbiE